jgi:glycosyltransferase 2 family protein
MHVPTERERMPAPERPDGACSVKDVDELTLSRQTFEEVAKPAIPGAVAEVELEEERSKSDVSLAGRFFNVRTPVSFAIGFAILLFLLTRVQVDVAGIRVRVGQANPLLLVLALVAFYSTFPLRALRWQRLLRNVGFQRRRGVRLPSVLGLAEIILLGWFANCIVPAKLGDAYRGYLLKMDAGVSFSKTFGTILAERIIDMLLLYFLMVTASSLAFGRALPPEIVILMQVGLALALVVLAGLIALPNLRPIAERLLPSRLHEQYHRFEAGTLDSFRGLPHVVLLSGTAWAGEATRLYLVAAALGVGGVAPSVVVFVALASALATTLPITPAGLGFAEGTIVGIFLLAAKAGLAPGVDDQTATSIALLDRSISYWSLIVVGLVAYLVTKRK